MVSRTLSQLYSTPRSIGKGGCAAVYRAVHRETGVTVALKISSINDSMDFVIREWLIYKRLTLHCPPGVGIPRPLEFGVTRNTGESVSTWMTLELLGPTVEELTRIGSISKYNFLEVCPSKPTMFKQSGGITNSGNPSQENWDS
jgi:serine/threonine protein kinase